MTQKTPTTAAEKDALIAEAADFGLHITRTSKSFFWQDGEDQVRVTPGRIIEMIEEVKEDARARAEAFEAAEAIRAEVEMSEATLEGQPDAALAQQPVSTTVDTTAPAKAAIKYGPPYGGQIAHLGVVILPESANPLMHLHFQPTTTFSSKEDARDHGRHACANGYLTFMAQHGTKRFWVAACVQADGKLEIDGHLFTLELLTGPAADAARAKVQGARWQQKNQFQAVAV